MSDKQTLQSQIASLKNVLASPKTDGTTRKILESGLRKAESKLEELEKAEKLESSKKELTPKQEAKVEETKKESKSLAQALKEKVKQAKQKIATTTPKATKKGGARSVAKAKEMAKQRRSTQKKQSLKDNDIESDANRYAINKTKRKSQGGRANQYGTKAENKGGTYYEKRENRYDVQNKRYAKLKKGGSLAEKYTFFGTSENGWYVKDKETNKFVRPMGKSVWDSKEEAIKDLKESKFKYEDGGTINQFGGTNYSTEDLSGMFAKGGYNDFGYHVINDEVTLKNGKKVFVTKGRYYYSNELGDNKPSGIYYVTKDMDKFISADEIMFPLGKMAYGGMMAMGGILEHGLKVGDKIIDVSDIDSSSIRVMNDGKYAYVNLSKGTRKEAMEYGGDTNQGTRFSHSKDPMRIKKNFENGGAITDVGGTQFSTEDLSGMFAKGGGVSDGVEMSRFHRNIMGTLSFDLKLSNMRKSQDFIVYPISKGDDYILIQSDTRIGRIFMTNGMGKMSQSHPNGAYGVHLQMDKLTPFQLDPSQILTLREELAKTAGKNVGSSIVKSDNEGASQFMMANGGVINRDLNLYAQKRANELGVTRKDLGYDYSNALAQALVEGLTDANSHSEVRLLISILEKRPEWANDPYADKGSVPDFGSPQYSTWRENSVYSSMYYDADDNTRQLGIDVSQKSGYDGYGIAMAFKYVAQMNGEQKLASNIDKVFGSTMAKGGYMANGGVTNSMEDINYIKGMSGLRASYLEEWANKNNVDLSKVANAMKTKKLKPMDLSTAISGRDGNKYAKDIIQKYSHNKMGMGGATFDDKVSSISKSLMKRKKVSPSVQKDYGKTYSKDESIDSAKRIAGAMRSKMMKKKS